MSIIFGAKELINAAGALDALDGNNINSGDLALVEYNNSIYFYILNANSTASENIPNVIIPNNNAGTKRWIRLSLPDTSYLLANNNLSDLSNNELAITNLGLSSIVYMAIGNTAGTVCAGNDTRLTDSRRCNNTFDDIIIARNALGLGDAALKNVGDTTGTVCAGDDNRLLDLVTTTNLVTSALTYATSSEYYANKSLTYATSASISEQNALTYATSANNSKENSSISEQNALTYATSANNSATSANNSKENSSISEQNALTYATSSEYYANKSLTYATSAQASIGGLKISSSDTTADNLENKLLAGNNILITKNNAGGDETLTLSTNDLAYAGNNYNITSLNGLTTPLSVAQGGTGSNTPSGARIKLELGTVATLNAGTSAYNVIQLDSSGRLPAVDGSLITNIFNNLSMRNAIKLSILAGDSSEAIPNGGWLNLFGTDEAATKTGAAYDSVNKIYLNSQAPSAISQGTGTAISNGIGPSIAFDGITVGAFTPSNMAYYNGDTLYIGKDWGVGVTKCIQKFVVYSSSNYGFGTSAGAGALTGNVSFTLLGSNTNDPTTATTLGSTASSNDNSISVTFSDTTISGLYRYHWVKIYNSTATQIGTTELVFYSKIAATNMTLRNTPITIGSVPTSISLTILHQSIDSLTYGTDIKIRASRDGGTTWSSYGTIANVGQYNSYYKQLFSVCDLSNTSSGNNIVWEITSYNNKAQAIRAVGWTTT